MTNPSSTIVRRLWNYCNVLPDGQRVGSARKVEAAVQAGAKRAARLRQIIPEGDVSPPGEAVLRTAFEGGCDIIRLTFFVR